MPMQPRNHHFSRPVRRSVHTAIAWTTSPLFRRSWMRAIRCMAPLENERVLVTGNGMLESEQAGVAEMIYPRTAAAVATSPAALECS